MRRDEASLADILDAIAAIRRYTAQGRQRFDDDELVRVWVLHHLEIIGEAASQLSAELRSQHPEVRWRGVIDLRNRLIHGYFEADMDVVWQVVASDLTVLERQVRTIVDELERRDEDT